MEEGADGCGGDGMDDTFHPMYFHAYGPMGHPMHGSAVSAVHYYLHDACSPGGSSHGGGYEPNAESIQRGGAGAASSSGAAYAHAHGAGSHSHHVHAHAQHQAHHHHHQLHHRHHHTQPYMHDAYLSMQLPGMVDFESAYSQPSLPSGGGLALMRQPSRPSLSRLSDRERYMSGGVDAEEGSSDPHPSLQQLLAAHYSPSLALERHSGGGGHVVFDGLSCAASAAAQQGALTHKGCRVWATVILPCSWQPAMSCDQVLPAHQCGCCSHLCQAAVKAVLHAACVPCSSLEHRLMLVGAVCAPASFHLCTPAAPSCFAP